MKIDNRNPLEQEMVGNWVDIEVAGQELRLVADIYRALRNNWKLLILAGIAGTVLGGGISFLREEKFEATAQVMINTQILVETNFTPVESGQPISTTVLESEIEVLRSLDLVEKVVDLFDLVKDPEFNANALSDGEEEAIIDEDTAVNTASIGDNVTPELDVADADQPPVNLSFDALREKIIANVAERRTVLQAGNISAVYAITFVSNDAQKAAILANALAEEYISTARNARIKSLELSQGWLQSRTEDLNLRLIALSVHREEFLQTAPFSPEEVETIKARNVSDSRRMASLNQDVATTLRDISILTSILAQGDIIAVAPNARRIAPEIEKILATALENPQEASAQLRTILTNANDQLNVRNATFETEVAGLKAEIASSRAVLVTQATRDAELSRIENDIIVVQAIYQDFVSQLSRRTQQDRYLDDDARIISAARPPLEPSEPNRRLIAIVAGVLAVLATFAKIVVSEIRQPKMRNRTEFEETTHLPFLGVIPEIKDLPGQLNILRSGVGTLDPVLARFARKLRVSLLSMPHYQTQAGRNGLQKSSSQIIAGASSSQGEGQSTALVALAVAFAEAADTVLYVEFETGTSDGPGPTILRSASATQSTNIPGLSFMTVNLSDNETSETQIIQQFRVRLDSLRGEYGHIILDAPALLVRVGAAQICQAADEIVQIGRWHHTTKKEIRSALRVLSNAGLSPVGVIATRFDLAKAQHFGDDTVYFYDKQPG